MVQCLSVYTAAGGLLLWARRAGNIDLLCLSLCLSVPTWAHSSKPAAGGLLLLAGDIDLLLHQRRANKGSAV